MPLRNGEELCAALRARQGEIEQVALARVRSVSDPAEIANPEYTEGLRAAVRAALAYGIEALGRSEERPQPIPTMLLSQARLAARNRVSLDTVLRRYLAGYTLLGDFLIEEAERAGSADATSVKRLLRAHAAAFDRVLAGVAEEYKRESGRPGSNDEHRARRIERLLAGEPLDTSAIPYDFEANHLAIVARGEGVGEALRELAAAGDRNLLVVEARDLSSRSIWAWFGGRQRFRKEDFEPLLAKAWPPATAIALGEPGAGLAGWRFSHDQAMAALPVALHGRERAVRYADVALLAAALQDEVLAASLRQQYLQPLAGERDGGKTARRTLRAYLAANCNVSSTAAHLQVDRKTVNSRIRAAEERLDRSVAACYAELETALRLHEISELPVFPNRQGSPPSHPYIDQGASPY